MNDSHSSAVKRSCKDPIAPDMVSETRIYIALRIFCIDTDLDLRERCSLTEDFVLAFEFINIPLVVWALTPALHELFSAISKMITTDEKEYKK
jgi:hypothetical protein